MENKDILTFDKVKGSDYIVVSGIEQLEALIKIKIAEISMVPVVDYNTSINNTIFEIMLSRAVAGCFIANNKEVIDKSHHVLISVAVNEQRYNVTVGTFDAGDGVGYLNGIQRV